MHHCHLHSNDAWSYSNNTSEVKFLPAHVVFNSDWLLHHLVSWVVEFMVRIYHVPGISYSFNRWCKSGPLCCWWAILSEKTFLELFLIFLFAFQESCVSSYVWFALFRWILNLWKKMLPTKGGWGWLDWLSLGATSY